ncbi:GntR family transcriptional regulator [uncultured Bilophila sp.]|uniref:GntR family transcriptional regulator n=1 Tax=uncultured Bilophila sp. TaxID=529385 RepID=UPI0026DD2A43|nr:GntR family transcriptional regulator [uncultured Bilophila sp.]
MHTFKRQTYSGQAVEFIKRCILDGELAPGEQVKEVMLAERLGISRAPIREALQILAQDGLITSEPQKGKFIRKMTRQEIEDEYEIGGILEGAGVAAALPAMTSVDVARLTGMVEHMARLAPKVGGLYEFSEVDEAFHNALLQHCANRRLVDMARSACANISKFLFYNHWNILFTPQEFVDRHRDILNSVLTGDPVEVEATLRAHYRESGRRMGQFGA